MRFCDYIKLREDFENTPDLEDNFDYDSYKKFSNKNIAKYSHYVGKRFIVVPGSYFANRFGEGATGKIHSIGGSNFSYTIDNQTTRKLTYDVKFIDRQVRIL